MIIETQFGTIEVNGQTTGKAWGSFGAEWIVYESLRGDVWTSAVATPVKRGRQTVYLVNGNTDKPHPTKDAALARIANI